MVVDTKQVAAIDLGTTFSSIGMMEGGRPKIIHNSKNENVTPTVLYFKTDGQILYGRAAEKYRLLDPKNTVGRFKIWLEDGKTYTSPAGKQFSGPEMVAVFLQQAVADAEKSEGKKFDEFVITCPAAASNQFREGLKLAAELAKIKLLGLRNEPEAAAMAFAIDKQSKDGIVVVLDWGGGTFDVSILEKRGSELDMLTSVGDIHLGGCDIDDALVAYFAQKFKDKHGIDPLAKPEVHARFLEQAVVAKHDLSDDDETIVSLSAEGHALDIELTREEFNKIVSPFVEKTLAMTQQALAEVNLKPAAVDYVVFVGGSSKIPLFEQRLTEYFGKQPVSGVSRELAVAYGATLDAARRAGVPIRGEKSERLPDPKVHTRLTRTVGILIVGQDGKLINFPMIKKGNRLPYKVMNTFTTVEDDQTSVQLTLLDGDSQDPKDCRPLVKDGKYTLDGIKPMAQGVPQIPIEIAIDESGIVNVHASELFSGASTQFTLKCPELMTPEEKLQFKDKSSSGNGAGA